ncbi:MAG TPA: tripartite tricarboxylate transporter substrate binding protein [Xanthobacteraceae bacterium]|jgi:tripartite-type tricarboxylate transporter receptor subunit TctC|nr:tripartite tricarboxylate transporter substrate binding protein [Xanthobacteraceae bacterium]
MSRSADHAKLALVALMLVTAGAASAQPAYPTHVVRIIAPFAAGGLNDTAARLIQPFLEKALGQTVVVENRTGASGIVGAEYVAKAPPDGHTLLMVASSYTVLPATTAVMPYDSERDLTPIVMVGKNPLLFEVNAKVPAKTLQGFVALAKASPGKLNYATPGAATQTRFVTELWSERAGIKMQHIPYRGGAPAIQALVAGQTEFSVLSPLVSLPQIAAGNLRALAVGSLTRYPQLPDVPTVAESGFPDFEAIQWVGLLTTAGTSKEIVDRLNADVNKALMQEALVAKLAQEGMLPAGGTPDGFARLIATEIKNYKATARAADIKPE